MKKKTVKPKRKWVRWAIIYDDCLPEKLCRTRKNARYILSAAIRNDGGNIGYTIKKVLVIEV